MICFRWDDSGFGNEDEGLDFVNPEAPGPEGYGKKFLPEVEVSFRPFRRRARRSGWYRRPRFKRRGQWHSPPGSSNA